MKPREFKEITEKESIKKILNTYADKKTFFIKGIDTTKRISFARKDHYLKLNFPDMFKENKYLTIFTLLNNYVEMDLKHIPHEELKHLYVVNKVKVAKKGRLHPRYDTKGMRIRLTKFENVKTRKDINPKKLPVYVRVILKSYENKYNEELKPIHILIDVYEKIIEEDPIAKLIRKDSKIVYVRDTSKVDDYLKQDENFISYIKSYQKMFFNYDPNISEEGRKMLLNEIKIEVNNEVRKEIEKWEEKEIKSFLYYPIIYDKNKYEFTDPFGLGLIKVYTDKGLKSTYIEQDIIEKLNQISEEACDAVSYGSTKSIEVNEEILNISKTGVRALITNPELKDTMLSHPYEEYKFDVNFPQLPKLTFWGRLAHYKIRKDHSVEVGIEFILEHKKEELRLRSIATLENYLKYLFEKKKK